MSPVSQTRMLEQEASTLLRKINNARSSADLHPLTISTALKIRAEAHASSLARARTLRPSALNIKVPYGENLHQCSPTRPATDAFTAWNEKKCARDNIFTELARYVGIGIVQGDRHAFVVMLFTRRKPDEGTVSDFGSVGSCTTQATVLQTEAETDVVTTTEWPSEKEDTGKENADTGKENADPMEKQRLPMSKALDIAHDTFNYMNGARRDAGVHYLRWDDGLYKQAFAHSERIFRLGRLLHSAKTRFENVAFVELGSTKNAGKLLSEKFMRRRENMLSSSFEYCAIAVFGDESKVYATQLFSRERVE